MCCPLSTTTSTTTTTTTASVIGSRFNLPIPKKTILSSIKNHRNIGLINSIKCGKDGADRVFGGSQTFLYQYKWNVLLQFRSTAGDEQLKFMCGGSLIAGN